MFETCGLVSVCCIICHDAIFITFITELYSTADVNNRKQQVADYNKVCYYM